MKLKPLLFVFLIVSLVLTYYVPEVNAQGTFGETSVSGASTSGYGADGRIYAGDFTFNGGAGQQADKITAYVNTNGGTGNLNWKCGIWKTSDNSLVGETDLAVVTESPAWVDFSFSSPPALVDATEYWLGVWLNDGDYYYFTESAKGNYQTISYNGCPNPFVPTATLNKRVCIYATYTSSAQDEKSFDLTASIAPSANVYEFKEKLFYGTETFVFSTDLTLFKEMIFIYGENIQTIATMLMTLERAFVTFTIFETFIVTAQVWMTTEIISAPADISTFGTLALVIAITALAISVVLLTKSR